MSDDDDKVLLEHTMLGEQIQGMLKKQMDKEKKYMQEVGSDFAVICRQLGSRTHSYVVCAAQISAKENKINKMAREIEDLLLQLQARDTALKVRVPRSVSCPCLLATPPRGPGDR